MKRIWMWGILAMLVASIPSEGWARQTATDIKVSGNLLPDSLRGENVNSIWIDANGDILAAIAYGGLIRSTDDGKTWERIFKKDFLSNFGFAVMRDKKTNALLLGTGGGTFRSTDEGGGWTRVWWEGGAGCFLTKQDGSILAGVGLGIGLSEDGGETWKYVFYDPTSYYFNVYALTMNRKTGAIFGGTTDTIGLGVLRSTDDGKTWQQANNGLGDLHVNAVASDENGVVYAGVEKKGLYRSTNDGDYWEKVPGFDASRQNVTEILVLKPDLIFVGFDWKGGIGGAKGGVFKYDGKVWTQIVADTAYTVMSLAVKGKSLLVGTSNALYRVDGAMDTPVSVDDYPLPPTRYTLSQNYPNPFNPSTTIEFSLPERGLVRLTVVNVLGQEVATLVAEERQAGTHRVEWNASGLPSGVYLYRLETGSFVQTKGMILLK